MIQVGYLVRIIGTASYLEVHPSGCKPGFVENATVFRTKHEDKKAAKRFHPAKGTSLTGFILDPLLEDPAEECILP